MNIPFYHLDAFTDQQFSGNPAAVCVLPAWYDNDMLQAIATENNMPVTAFIVNNNNVYEVRWMTPEYELNLCGHGSLAAAYVIFNFIEPTAHEINLKSRYDMLTVTRDQELVTLNFPAKEIQSASIPILTEGLGLLPDAMYQYQSERCLAVYANETAVRNLNPDMTILRQLPHRGIIVTALGDSVDFVSRTFYPHKTMTEDSVTGASHCLLVPYWAKRLDKNKLHAKQVSKRGGELFCDYQNDRVLMSGKVCLYATGSIIVSKR